LVSRSSLIVSPLKAALCRFFAFAAAACIFAADCSFAAEVFIDVKRKRGALIWIGVPAFSFKPSSDSTKKTRALGKKAKNILRFDLAFSGYFHTITDEDVLSGIEEKERATGEIDWDAWKELGLHSLVKGEYHLNSDGEIVIAAWLYDVERMEQIIGIRYTGSEKLFRKMIHRFANRVIYRFTGEPGVAETRLAFISRAERRKELFTSDYDGFNPKRITNDRSVVLSPAWSPDGKQILYTTYRTGQPHIYSTDIDTGLSHAVSVRKGLNSAPAWSPDGKRIAFTLSTRGNSDIYLIDANGRGLRRLTYRSSIETSPSWSPDGKKIVYVSDFPGTPQLYIMDVADGKPKRFTFNGSYNADPAWSPKGDKIAYAGLVDESFNIMIKGVKGRLEKQLTLYAGGNEHPSWSPDGRNIAFASTRKGGSQIFIMNENGENQIQITNMRGGAYSPSWSPPL